LNVLDLEIFLDPWQKIPSPKTSRVIATGSTAAIATGTATATSSETATATAT
jgi:hypothetical protein